MIKRALSLCRDKYGHSYLEVFWRWLVEDSFFGMATVITCGIMCGLIAVVLVASYITMAIGSRMELPGTLASIEQLRSDAEHLCGPGSEHVVAQVVAQNRQLAKARRMNKIWWADPAIPDALAEVPLILIVTPADCK